MAWAALIPMAAAAVEQLLNALLGGERERENQRLADENRRLREQLEQNSKRNDGVARQYQRQLSEQMMKNNTERREINDALTAEIRQFVEPMETKRGPAAQNQAQLSQQMMKNKAERRELNDTLTSQIRQFVKPMETKKDPAAQNQQMYKNEKQPCRTNDVLPASNHQFSQDMDMNDKDQKTINDELDVENMQLEQQLAYYRKEQEEQLEQMNKILADLKDRKLDSFEALEKNDKKAKEALINLAQQAKPIGMEGNNIAIFGLTSSGKSTMLNSLLGEKVAATGMGEATLEVASYAGRDFVLWDIPGRNDELSYMSLEYISFCKGLTRRLILLEHTIKENSGMMKFLDAIGLDYDIVVNKVDRVDEDERQEFCEQIKKEIVTVGLKRVGRAFFVSAKYPQQFPDWLEMVHYLSIPSK